jgi:NAD(P) transhydrogenase subunit alpha
MPLHMRTLLLVLALSALQAPVAMAQAPPASSKTAAEQETEGAGSKPETAAPPAAGERAESSLDFWSMVFVFMLATFIGVGVIRRVSRLLHTPLMSLTNAISAIAVVGSIMLAGGKHYPNNWYHFWGAVALFASMTNIVSGFLITDRMLKMFKTREGAK